MSAEKFDPYYKWLGIGPDERPISYYRLLGIRNFEEDADVIDSSADRQMSHVQSFKIGKYADLSQKLLNEISTARVCLLNKEKKAAYDQKLKQQLAGKGAGKPASKKTKPQAAARPAPQTRAAPPRAESRPFPVVWLAAGGAVLIVCAAAGLALWGLSEDAPREPNPTEVATPETPDKKTAVESPDEPGLLVFDWPLDQRQRATLKIDGRVETIPRDARFKISARAGSHQIEITRHAHQPLKFGLALRSGETRSIPLDWQPAAGLTIDWPEEDRDGASLTINGALRQLPAGNPVTFAVEPGGHTVQIARPGFKPFQQQVEIEPGESAELRPQLAALAPANVDPVAPAGNGGTGTLLPRVVLDQHVLRGEVQRSQQMLTLAANTSVQIPQELPREYALFLMLHRTQAPGGVVLSLPRGDARMVIHLSVGDPPTNGLELADQPFDSNKTTRRGEVLGTDVVRVLCMVRETRIGLSVNGVRVIDTFCSQEELACPEAWQPKNAEWLELHSTESPLQVRFCGLINFSTATATFNRLPPLAARTETPDPVPTDPPPADPPPVDPPAAPARLAIPDAAAQATALKQIREIFANEYGSREPAEQIALARRLMQEAIATTEDPASRFVLLDEARTFATRWGELDTAWETIKAAARWYEVDSLELKLEVLRTASRRVRGPQLTRLAELCLDSIQQAVRADRFDLATNLVTLAVPAARGAQNTELNDLAQLRAVQVRQLRDEHRRIERALGTLKETPDDPVANLAVGRYCGLYKGDWETALPLLVKGSEGTLKQLALQDLDAPEENERQVALGDAWWAESEQARDLPQLHLQNRAAYWYRLALADASGIVKTRIERRVLDVPKSPFDSDAPTASGGLALPELSPEEVAKQHRALAERVIKLGGGVTLRDSTNVMINQVPRLPDQPFLLARAYLSTTGTPELNDQHLAVFEGVRNCPVIYLTSPRITDAGIAYLAANADLTGLVLNQSSITDVGLAPLVKCKNLARLEVSSNQLNGVGLAQLATLENLQFVSMRGNAISDRVFEVAATLPRVYMLEVQGNQLTGAGLAAMKGNTTLRTLSVSGPNVTDEAVNTIITFSNLSSLSLNGGRVTETAMARLAALTRLSILSLTGPQVTDALIPHLAKFPALQSLGLYDTSVRGSTIASLAGARSLVALYFTRGAIGDAGLAELPKLTALKRLRLMRVNITDAGVAHLAKMKQLEYLELSITEISDASIPALQQLTRLQALDVNRTRITKAGANTLRQALPNCKVNH